MADNNWFGNRLNNDNEKPRSPLRFGSKDVINPISSVDTDINSLDRFAITALTENGKYVRGSSIYYKLDNVEVFAPIDSIIFVDKTNNTVFIRNQEKEIANVVKPSDPEEKQYIILYTDLGYETAEFPFRWESVTGRSGAYESVKVNASVVDVDRSIVLTENVSVKDALSVREFVNYLKNSNLVSDEDDFDINIYAGSEYI